jgi:hypothetical protein
LSAYTTAEASIVKQLQDSDFPVHFSFDLWPSPNQHPFFGLVGHWVDVDGKLRVGLLGMECFKRPHSGINQAAVIWKILERLKISLSVGYFTTDNASNNDSSLKALVPYFEDVDIPFNPISSRIRCFGHIINLVVKAFLWGNDEELFEISMESNDGSENDLALAEGHLEDWRKCGALGRLHNICVWSLHSPHRRDCFEEKVLQLLPGSKVTAPLVGNVTCWHGDVDALERAFVVRETIEGFVCLAIAAEQQPRSLQNAPVQARHGHDKSDPECIQLDQHSLNDWDDLKIMYEILGSFKYWTLQLEGSSTAAHRPNGYIPDVLPDMDELLQHLEDCRIRYQHGSNASQNIVISISSARQVLDKYYSLRDLAPVMCAAVALHPEMKYQYFEDQWNEQPAWNTAAHHKIETLWHKIYHSASPPSTAASDFDVFTLQSLASSSVSGLGQVVPRWKQKRAKHTRAVHQSDQLRDVQHSAPEEEISDLMEFWQTKLHTSRSSHLSRMALPIHSIPAMSAEVEPVFSSSKILLSDQRNRLSDDVIAAVECLKSWSKEGLVEAPQIENLQLMLTALELES